MHISRSFPLIQHNQGYLHPAGALSTYFIGNYEVELAFHSTRSYAAQRAASRPRLNRWARIQFGRVHSGMFSKPPASGTCPDLSSVIRQMTGSDDFSLLTGDPN